MRNYQNVMLCAAAGLVSSLGGFIDCGIFVYAAVWFLLAIAEGARVTRKLWKKYKAQDNCSRQAA